jgi:hypothetical protein
MPVKGIRVRDEECGQTEQSKEKKPGILSCSGPAEIIAGAVAGTTGTRPGNGCPGYNRMVIPAVVFHGYSLLPVHAAQVKRLLEKKGDYPEKYLAGE